MTQLHPGLYFVSLDLVEGVYRRNSGWYGEAQCPLAGVLAIRTWACWGRNKWVGIGLMFWMLPCQIPAGIFMHKFLDSLRCEFLEPRIQFRADCETVGSPPGDSGSNSCFVVYSNQLLWGNWFVLLVGEGGELRPTTNPTVTHQGFSRSDPHGYLRLPEL